MNRQRNVIMVALAALVAGAAVLVYAQDGEKTDLAQKEAQGAPAGNNNLDEPQAKEQEPATGAPKVLYDLATLPDPVQRMLTEIIFTAQGGNIEAMRPVLESNELKPMVAAAHVDDPIAYWKEQSVDGTGRDVLAAMLNVLASGFVLTGTGHDEMYVWPYFAEVDVTKLTPEQEVELYRAVPPQLAAAIKKSGKYAYYRLGISPTGVWHYFLQ